MNTSPPAPHAHSETPLSLTLHIRNGRPASCCLDGTCIAGRKPRAASQPTATWKVERRHLREALGQGTQVSLELALVTWQSRPHCAYLADYRIAGSKPWGGGAITKAWRVKRATIEAALADAATGA